MYTFSDHTKINPDLKYTYTLRFLSFGGIAYQSSSSVTHKSMLLGLAALGTYPNS